MWSSSTFWDIQDEAARRASIQAMKPYVIYEDKEIDGYRERGVPFPFIGTYEPEGWEALRDEDGDVLHFQCDIPFTDGRKIFNPVPHYFLDKIRQFEGEAEEKGETYGYAVIEAGQFQMVVGVFRKTGEPEKEVDEDEVHEFMYEKQLEIIGEQLSYHVDSRHTAAPTPEGEKTWEQKVFSWLFEHDQLALEMDTHVTCMPEFSLRRALPALVALDLFAEDSQLVLRDVDLDGHRLQMWDCQERYRPDMPQDAILYRLTDPEGNVVFFDSDFGANVLDADETVRSLVNFLTLCDGDVEDEYFKDYTPEQIAWRDKYAEQLQVWALDLECSECGGGSMGPDPECPDCGGSGLHGNPQLYGEEGEETVFRPWGYEEKTDGQG